MKSSAARLMTKIVADSNYENSSLVVERDGLLRERQFMREELDRILARFTRIDEEAP